MLISSVVGVNVCLNTSFSDVCDLCRAVKAAGVFHTSLQNKQRNKFSTHICNTDLIEILFLYGCGTSFVALMDMRGIDKLPPRYLHNVHTNLKQCMGFS